MALLSRVVVLLAVGLPVLAGGVTAQQAPGPTATPATVESGKKLFVQRCSVCHLPPMGPGEPRSYARSLTGIVKTPQMEAGVRQIIEKGIPSRMPGFQYGLQPKEIDQIVTYLATLK